MNKPSRLKHYFTTHVRVKEVDELPWVRPPGLSKLTLPRPVVLVNGCFDLFHPAHAKLIFAAREKATPGTLVCALDSDDRVREMKGPQRPIMTFIERATMLGYMPVDYLVEVDGDEDMVALIEAIKPDLRVQGSDHKGRKTRFPSIPKMFVSRTKFSSTDIINRIIKRYGK